MAFNPENRITWEELAPSLQELFKVLNTKIDREIERAIAAEKEIWEYLDGLTFGMTNGGKGQVLKIDVPGKSIKADDNFHVMRMVSDGLGTTITKKVPPLSLKEVFNTWPRYAINQGYQGSRDPGPSVSSSGYHGDAHYTQEEDGVTKDWKTITNAWSYNASKQAILNNGNWHLYCMFISKENYDNWEITVKLTQGTINDDDMLGIVVAAYKDSSGFMHSVSVAIHGNSQSPNAGQVTTAQGHMPQQAAKHKLVLTYDYNSASRSSSIPGKEEIVLAYDNTCKGDNYSAGTVLLNVKREGSKIYAKRTNFGSSSFVSSIEWAIPTTQPAGWSNDAWTNMQEMLLNPSPMGFATMSNDCYFQIVNQKDIFLDETIYDVLNGKKYVYVDGVWVETTMEETSDDIPWRCWIWNRITGDLYWYMKPGVYYKVHSDLELRKILYEFPVGNGELEDSLIDWDGHGGTLDTYLDAQGIVPDYNNKKILDRVIHLGG